MKLIDLNPLPGGLIFAVVDAQKTLYAVFVLPGVLTPSQSWRLLAAVKTLYGGREMEMVLLESCELTGKLLPARAEGVPSPSGGNVS